MSEGKDKSPARQFFGSPGKVSMHSDSSPSRQSPVASSPSGPRADMEANVPTVSVIDGTSSPEKLSAGSAGSTLSPASVEGNLSVRSVITDSSVSVIDGGRTTHHVRRRIFT